MKASSKGVGPSAPAQESITVCYEAREGLPTMLRRMSLVWMVRKRRGGDAGVPHAREGGIRRSTRTVLLPL